jgi:hypothetical protein
MHDFKKILSTLDLEASHPLIKPSFKFNINKFMRYDLGISLDNFFLKKDYTQSFILGRTFILFFIANEGSLVTPTRWYKRNKNSCSFLDISRLYEYIILEYI